MLRRYPVGWPEAHITDPVLLACSAGMDCVQICHEAGDGTG
jgi:hypothetical protein